MAYGVEIYNSSGELILGQTTRLANVIVSGSTTLTTSSTSPYTATSGSISFPGLSASNSAEYGFWTADNSIDISSAQFESIAFNRSSETFTVTYNSITGSKTRTINWLGIRY